MESEPDTKARFSAFFSHVRAEPRFSICQSVEELVKQADEYLVPLCDRDFLDYLRNDRLSTAVALLSPRARTGATVSMPVTWAQARGDLDPKRYTVRTVPALLGKTKAWDGYEDAASSIKPAMKKLADKL